MKLFSTAFPQTGTELKLLAIGNSFSDDSMQYVYEIAKSLGIEKITLGNLYIGGCTLDTHAANAEGDRRAYEYRTHTGSGWITQPDYKISDAIRWEDWDYISLQQASGSSGITDTYGKLDFLIDYVRRLAKPSVKLVWNMTWAYQQDSTHSEFYKYQNDQSTMYRMITDTVKEQVLPRREISLIIPTGTAIQNARTSFTGDHLTRDGYHLSMDFGRYIAGLTFVKALTGQTIDSVRFTPEGVDEAHRMIAIEAVRHAIDAPFEVTQSI